MGVKTKSYSTRKKSDEVAEQTGKKLQDTKLSSREQMMESIKLRKEINIDALDDVDKDIAKFESQKDKRRKGLFVKLEQLQDKAEEDYGAKNEWSRLMATFGLMDAWELAVEMEEISSVQRQNAQILQLTAKYIAFPEFNNPKKIEPLS